MSRVSRYPIPAGEVWAEIVVQRSRFAATLAPAESVERAACVLARLRAEHPEATHHCHAWAVGPPGSTAQVALSDDGEPHGTAGRPLLDVLLGSGLGDVVVIVTRWFGGTKLGRGGLVRAYSAAAAAALERVERTEHVTWERGVVHVDYAGAEALRSLYDGFEVVVEDTDFGAEVVHRLRLPAERVDDFRRALADATNGRARYEGP